MLPFSESFRYFLLDLFSRSEIKMYYKLFTDSCSWTRDKLTDFQNRRLKDLVMHSYKNIPYYQTLFNNCSLTPDDIKGIDDLQKLPILTRDLLRENNDILKDKSNNYRVKIAGSSSGTTGIPVKYIHDRQCESAGIAAGYALYNLSGWTLGKRRLHIWGNPASVSKWSRKSSRLKREVLNQKNYPAFFLNDTEKYNNLLSVIKGYNPEFIDGYASSIGSFASWLREKDIKIKGVRAVFTTAENLTQNFREAITEVIGPVSDLYGSGEINGIAIQPINSNNYYILESHVVVERLDYNGSSELIVTDLDARYMPLIRYKLGDTVDNVYPPDDNDGFPFQYFRFINGRTADFIKLNSGKIIHPVNLLGGTFIRKFPEIRKHKVIWDGAILNFVLEAPETIDRNKLNETIRDNIMDYGVPFTVTIKNEILPSASGKYRYIEVVDQVLK